MRAIKETNKAEKKNEEKVWKKRHGINLNVLETGISKERAEKIQRHREEKERVRRIKDREESNRVCWKREEEVEVFLWKLECPKEGMRDPGRDRNKRLIAERRKRGSGNVYREEEWSEFKCSYGNWNMERENREESHKEE